MQDAVEHGSGEHGVARERLVPAAEGQVGGEDHGPRSRCHNLEEQVGLLAAVCEELGVYLAGWKGYFRIAETPRVLADIDKWIRHRLRALQLKYWKRGPTIFRELRQTSRR